MFWPRSCGEVLTDDRQVDAAASADQEVGKTFTHAGGSSVVGEVFQLPISSFFAVSSFVRLRETLCLDQSDRRECLEAGLDDKRSGVDVRIHHGVMNDNLQSTRLHLHDNCGPLVIFQFVGKTERTPCASCIDDVE